MLFAHVWLGVEKTWISGRMIAGLTCDVVFKEAPVANRINEPDDRNKSEISQKNILKLDEVKKNPVNSKPSTTHLTKVNFKSDKIEQSIKSKQSSTGQVKSAPIASQFKDMNKLKSKQHVMNHKDKSYLIIDKHKPPVQSSDMKPNLINKKTDKSKTASFSSSNAVDKDKFFKGK